MCVRKRNILPKESGRGEREKGKGEEKGTIPTNSYALTFTGDTRAKENQRASPASPSRIHFYLCPPRNPRQICNSLTYSASKGSGAKHAWSDIPDPNDGPMRLNGVPC